MSTIHLWDNTWHVSPPNECKKDQFGRVPRDLIIGRGGQTAIKTLSMSSIGDLMSSENNSVLVVPHSFHEDDSNLKDQRIFRISLDFDGSIKSITTDNVVGFIGQGNTDFRIHSRFSNHTGEINDFFLYYMMERVLSINLVNLPTSASNKDFVFDFLLLLFPKMLKDALSQGLYKKYVYHEYNNANVHGVIDINRHIQLNIPANGHIAYRTREFSYDNPVTQLIRHTIEFIRRKTFGKVILHNDSDTEAGVQQIIQATPTYSIRQQQVVINDNLRPVIHPYFTKYSPLQKLCLSILRHDKLCFNQSNNEKKIRGILIDASWLWEEYLALVLTEYGSNLKHYTLKDAPMYLFKKDTDQVNNQFQQIIPDYFDGKQVVADAKYIPLHNSDHLSADRAAAVYYKTIMYMYRFNSTKGYLFHPCSSDDIKTIKNNPPKYGHISTDNNVVFCDYEIVGRNNCHLYEVGMIIPSVKHDDDNQSLDEPAQEPQEQYSAFKEKMDAAEKAFAKKLTSS